MKQGWYSGLIPTQADKSIMVEVQDTCSPHFESLRSRNMGVEGSTRASTASGGTTNQNMMGSLDLGDVGEQVDELSLQLRSTILNDNPRCQRQLGGSDVLQPDGQRRRNNDFTSNLPRPTRTQTAGPFSTTFSDAPRPYPFPGPVTFPLASPADNLTPSSAYVSSALPPSNYSRQPSSRAQSDAIPHRHFDSTRYLTPSRPPTTFPSAEPPQHLGQPTVYVFGVPISQVQPMHITSFTSADTVPSPPRASFESPLNPGHGQLHQHQVCRDVYEPPSAPAPQLNPSPSQFQSGSSFRYDPDISVLPSENNNHGLTPFDYSSRYLHSPQDRGAAHDVTSQMQDRYGAPILFHESSMSIHNQLEAVDTAESLFEESAVAHDMGERGKLADTVSVDDVAYKGSPPGVIDDLHEIPDKLDSTAEAEKALLRLMTKLENLNLTDLCPPLIVSVACGGQADIYRVRLSDGREVAVKIFRFDMRSDIGSVKRITRELRISFKVNHKNVLPFLGFVQDRRRFRPGLVTPWEDAGNLRKYMDGRRGIDVHGIILGIARGLKYLHEMKIVHGDLKPENIIVKAGPTPMLMDFGLSHLQNSTSTFESATDGSNGTLRYMARELLISEENTFKLEHTTFSDVWAFGMIGQEILTGRRPYNEYSNRYRIIRNICEGVVPELPSEHHTWEDRDQMLWMYMQDCWAPEPKDRPDMTTLLRQISDLI